MYVCVLFVGLPSGLRSSVCLVFVSVCVSACLRTCLACFFAAVCLSLCLSVCPPVCPSGCLRLPAFPPACLFACLPSFLPDSAYLSACLSFCVCPHACLFLLVCLPVYISASVRTPACLSSPGTSERSATCPARARGPRYADRPKKKRRVVQQQNMNYTRYKYKNLQTVFALRSTLSGPVHTDHRARTAIFVKPPANRKELAAARVSPCCGVPVVQFLVQPWSLFSTPMRATMEVGVPLFG